MLPGTEDSGKDELSLIMLFNTKTTSYIRAKSTEIIDIVTFYNNTRVASELANNNIISLNIKTSFPLGLPSTSAPHDIILYLAARSNS